MMTAQEILHEVNEEFLEYLEMMSVEEQFILIRNALAQKLAFEMAEKEYYKSCWNAAILPNSYKGLNS